MQEVSFLTEVFAGGICSLNGIWLFFLLLLLTLKAPSSKACVLFCGRDSRGVQFCHPSYLITYVINVILLLKIPKSIQWLAQDNYGLSKIHVCNQISPLIKAIPINVVILTIIYNFY